VRLMRRVPVRLSPPGGAVEGQRGDHVPHSGPSPSRGGNGPPTPPSTAIASNLADLSARAGRAPSRLTATSWPSSGRFGGALSGRPLPARGRPDAQGDVVDGVVTRPWHGWSFRADERPSAPTATAARYGLTR
jgi:hypothetical protein